MEARASMTTRNGYLSIRTWYGRSRAYYWIFNLPYVLLGLTVCSHSKDWIVNSSLASNLLLNANTLSPTSNRLGKILPLIPRKRNTHSNGLGSMQICPLFRTNSFSCRSNVSPSEYASGKITVEILAKKKQLALNTITLKEYAIWFWVGWP